MLLSPTRRRPAVPAGLLAALVLTTLLLAPAPAAQAHPFGPPQTVQVDRDGGEVTVRWRFGASDDIAYLAIGLGVLPEDRATLDGAVFFEDGDAPLLAGSDRFHDYLREHVTVSTAEGRCAGTVRPTEDLVQHGITLAFTCPRASTSVEVGVDMLLDQHPAYRTLATGPDGQRAVYDADHRRHEWRLGAAPAGAAGPGPAAGTGRSAAVQLGAVGGALAVLALGAWLWRRRSVVR